MIPLALRRMLGFVSARVDLSGASIGPWIVGILFALPTIIVHYPPMTDLPFHEAILGGLVHWGNDLLVPRTVYALNFGHPNQLFYFLGYPLAKVLGTTLAIKLVVAGSQIVTAVAAARLARHWGAPWWSCQIVAASTIGWLYFWGLVANMLGLAVMLLALPDFDRFAREPNARRAAAVSGWIVLLYLAHESSLLSVMLAFGVTAILLPPKAKRWLWNAVPVLAAGGLGIGEFVLHWSLKSAAQRAEAGEVIFDTPWLRLPTIAQSIGGYYPPPIDWALMSLMLVPLVLGVVVRLAWGTPSEPRAESTRVQRTRAWLYERRALVLSGTFFFLYLTFPTQLLSATLLHQRFLHPAFAIFASWAIPRSSPNPRGNRLVRLARVTATLALAGPLLTAWPAFQEADVAYTQLDQLISVIQPGQALFVQEVFLRNNAKLFTAATACGHVVALRGGRCAYDFTQSPISPLLMKPDRIWNNASFRLLSRSGTWPMPAYDFQRFRYMLLWAPPRAGELQGLVGTALQPTAKQIAAEGQWAVYESVILRDAIDSHEPPMEPPPPKTFKALMRDASHRYLQDPAHK